MSIAAQSGSRKGDLSKFIVEAARTYMLERAVDQAKVATFDMTESKVTDLVDEVVQWTRER